MHHHGPARVRVQHDRALREPRGAFARACGDARIRLVPAHAVRPRHQDHLRGGEVQILRGDRGEVQPLDLARIRHNVRALHRGDDRVFDRVFREALLHGRHLEAVDVVPERQRSGVAPEPGDVDGRDVRKNRAAGLEQEIARLDHRVEHALEEQRVPHPLAHQHVERVLSQRVFLVTGLVARRSTQKLLNFSLHDGDHVAKAVVRDVGASHRGDVGGAVHAHHLGGAAARREHAQDARAAPDVQHALAFHARGVLLQRHAVRRRARDVVEHHAVDVEVRVAAEVVLVHGLRRRLFFARDAGVACAARPKRRLSSRLRFRRRRRRRAGTAGSDQRRRAHVRGRVVHRELVLGRRDLA